MSRNQYQMTCEVCGNEEEVKRRRFSPYDAYEDRIPLCEECWADALAAKEVSPRP